MNSPLIHFLADNDVLTQTQNCKVDFNVETVMAEVELSSTLTPL